MDTNGSLSESNMSQEVDVKYSPDDFPKSLGSISAGVSAGILVFFLLPICPMSVSNVFIFLGQILATSLYYHPVSNTVY